MSEWYYTSAGQQVGPVTSAQLKQAAQSGLLAPTDLVWKDGMPDWVPATKLKGIFDAAPAAAPVAAAHVPASPAATTPVATTQYDAAPAAVDASPGVYAPHAGPQPQPARQPNSQIGYYNPTAGLGARLANNLKGFPAPTGPQDQWPLADVHLGQLAVAESYRKHIRALASLFQLFFVLGVIGSIVVVIAAVFGVALGGGRGAGAAAVGLGVAAAFVVGITILYYFGARETRRCRIWPAIVFACFYGLAIIFNFASLMMMGLQPSGPGSVPGALAGSMFGAVLASIIPFAFLWMCIKALTSIPKFLACPVWAQEALVAAKL